jgi:hypothetical protein
MNERPVQRPDCRTIGARPCEVGGLSGFQRAELGHCDQQSKGGDVGDAGNAGQDGEAIGEACVRFDHLENCRFDRRNLPVDLFEALSILTFQQRERQSFSAVLGGGSIFHQGVASDVEFLEFKQDLASGRAGLQFQQGAHARQNRRIQAIGLRQLAGRLGEAARLTRIDLDERNVRGAERTFESAMIRPGRFEHDPVQRRLREPFDKRFMTSLCVGETSCGAVGQAMSVEMV